MISPLKKILKTITRIRYVMESIILFFNNLSAEELKKLLFFKKSMNEAYVQKTLNSFYVILDASEDLKESVRI
jgi:hypothetical protein